MSVARVGLDAISTSLQLSFPTSHVCCEQVNQNLARSCQIQVEVSQKNVDCEIRQSCDLARCEMLQQNAFRLSVGLDCIGEEKASQ